MFDENFKGRQGMCPAKICSNNTEDSKRKDHKPEAGRKLAKASAGGNAAGNEV